MLLEITNLCGKCAHKEICRFINEYSAFCNGIEDVITRHCYNAKPPCLEVSVRCKYYQKVIPVSRGLQYQQHIFEELTKDLKETKCDSENSNNGVSIKSGEDI